MDLTFSDDQDLVRKQAVKGTCRMVEPSVTRLHNTLAALGRDQSDASVPLLVAAPSYSTSTTVALCARSLNLTDKVQGQAGSNTTCRNPNTTLNIILLWFLLRAI